MFSIENFNSLKEESEVVFHTFVKGMQKLTISILYYLLESTKPSNYITYLDANNLYGWAMSEDLSTGGFRWVSEKN